MSTVILGENSILLCKHNNKYKKLRVVTIKNLIEKGEVVTTLCDKMLYLPILAVNYKKSKEFVEFTSEDLKKTVIADIDTTLIEENKKVSELRIGEKIKKTNGIEISINSISVNTFKPEVKKEEETENKKGRKKTNVVPEKTQTFLYKLTLHKDAKFINVDGLKIGVV